MITKASQRVLFVDQTAQLGGAELSLLDLVRIRKGGDKVVLFDEGPFAEGLRELDVDVEICPLSNRVASIRKESGIWSKMSALTGTIKIVRTVAAISRDYDLLYANTPKAFVIAALASVLARKPLVYHLRDILTASHFSKFNCKLIVTLANRFAGQVIANSQATADAFIAAGGKRSLIAVVHNGIDIAPYDSAIEFKTESRDRLRSELNIADGPCLAVFGRLSPWKGQHLAIEALKQVQGAQLLLVGEALFGENEYVAQLRQLAEHPAVKGRVYFLGFRRDVPELMQLADIVIHCSTAPEPFGRVIVEAMLSRRPIIASAAGGANEIVIHGETGWLTAIGSIDDLVSAIQMLLSQPGVAVNVADSGYESARQRFRIETKIEQINRLIASLCLAKKHSSTPEVTQQLACGANSET